MVELIGLIIFYCFLTKSAEREEKRERDHMKRVIKEIEEMNKEFKV